MTIARGTRRRRGAAGRRGRVGLLPAAVAALLALAACGEDDPVMPDPNLAPFIGTWDAEVLTLAALPPSTATLDVIGAGGSFHITVEPSGTYSAGLSLAGQTSGEVGQLNADPATSSITIDPTSHPGPTTTGTYGFPADDYLIIDGETEFDFNFDGTDEPAEVHFELRRR
ncbi:MAG TPA: hypothetical protein VFQ22_04585 [Longimicrobiales bacterium]|nr:hypothetical protein [Longimicrobiales bacterium]